MLYLLDRNICNIKAINKFASASTDTICNAITLHLTLTEFLSPNILPFFNVEHALKLDVHVKVYTTWREKYYTNIAWRDIGWMEIRDDKKSKYNSDFIQKLF